MQSVRPVGLAIAALAALALLSPVYGYAAGGLELETKIPLGDVRGRIDHFAVDEGRQRLFVAELGNDIVAVVDLQSRKLLRTIAGLSEPQGIGYEAATDTLYVANAGDGSVRLFRGADYLSDGRIELGGDADNVRVEAQSQRVFVGYGKGGIAIIDPATRVKVADIALKAHPESFQIDRAAGRLYANVPDARHIAVVDIAASRQIGSWMSPATRSNFPMALDPASGQVVAGFRSPPKLIAFAANGTVAAALDICGDTDDVFADPARRRFYVSCGDGVVDVVGRSDTGFTRLGRIPTSSGARTSFFHSGMDRLFVAIRATAREPAAIWVYRPTP
jgi:DNA-binding beta-propeller fold protein YncE